MATDRKPTGDKALGRRLYAAREAKGLSQAELAKKIGKGQSTVAGYERGSDYPGPDALDACCEVLEISMDWLHGRSVMSNRAEDFYKEMISRVKRKNLRDMGTYLDDEDLEDAAAALDAFLESRIQRKKKKKTTPKKKTNRRR